MREDIELVRQMGTKRDEITAYEIMIEEQKYVKQENEVSTVHQSSFRCPHLCILDVQFPFFQAETERIKERLRDIDEKVSLIEILGKGWGQSYTTDQAGKSSERHYQFLGKWSAQ